MAPLRPEKEKDTMDDTVSPPFSNSDIEPVSAEYAVFWGTLQSYGFSERLQVRLYRAVCLCGRGAACDSGRGTRRPWRWNFATQETDEIFTSNSSSAFLNPCNHILVPALVAQMDA